jgi:hypothetical protein
MEQDPSSVLMEMFSGFLLSQYGTPWGRTSSHRPSVFIADLHWYSVGQLDAHTTWAPKNSAASRIISTEVRKGAAIIAQWDYLHHPHWSKALDTDPRSRSSQSRTMDKRSEKTKSHRKINVWLYNWAWSVTYPSNQMNVWFLTEVDVSSNKWGFKTRKWIITRDKDNSCHRWCEPEPSKRYQAFTDLHSG